MKSVIRVNNLIKEFKAKQKAEGLKGSLKSIFFPEYKIIKAVDQVSFNVKKGEIIGFIGPNGAGKSTTIKMMSGILFPSHGEISILGFNPQKERKKLAQHIGTVFGQKPQLWYHLPAIDTFNLFSKIYGLEEKEYKERLDYLVELFQVKEFINQPVRKLSLGQRMRCEFIASLLHKPKIIFLDEPTIGIDIVVKKRIREMIKELNKKEDITIILTSHDMEDVETICKRLIIIDEGKIVYDGTTKKIKDDYLDQKIIHVIFSEKVNNLNLNLEGVNVAKRSKDYYKYQIKVDTSVNQIQEVIKKLISKHKVEDINILDPQIETIIHKIFSKEV